MTLAYGFFRTLLALAAAAVLVLMFAASKRP